jgi:hypothetical protein
MSKPGEATHTLFNNMRATKRAFRVFNRLLGWRLLWRRIRAGLLTRIIVGLICRERWFAADYSWRKAIMGSTCMARRAGTNPASVATVVRVIATAARVMGSFTEMPKSMWPIR